MSDIISKYSSLLSNDDKEEIINNDIDKIENICAICCNECTEKCQELKCNHKFCDECIKGWYIKLNVLKKNQYYNYKKYRECPVCRQDGGYLKLRENETPIKNIHKEFGKKQKNKSMHICNAPFTTKEGFCQCLGKEKYGWYCGRHKKYQKLKPKEI